MYIDSSNIRMVTFHKDGSAEILFKNQTYTEIPKSRVYRKINDDNLAELDFYGLTWTKCFDEFKEWYEQEMQWSDSEEEFREKYPTFKDALKDFREYLNKETL